MQGMNFLKKKLTRIALVISNHKNKLYLKKL